MSNLAIFIVAAQALLLVAALFRSRRLANQVEHDRTEHRVLREKYRLASVLLEQRRDDGRRNLELEFAKERAVLTAEIQRLLRKDTRLQEVARGYYRVGDNVRMNHDLLKVAPEYAVRIVDKYPLSDPQEQATFVQRVRDAVDANAFRVTGWVGAKRDV